MALGTGQRSRGARGPLRGAVREGDCHDGGRCGALGMAMLALGLGR
jgi:hypothetical protein